MTLTYRKKSAIASPPADTPPVDTPPKKLTKLDRTIESPFVFSMDKPPADKPIKKSLRNQIGPGAITDLYGIYLS